MKIRNLPWQASNAIEFGSSWVTKVSRLMIITSKNVWFVIIYLRYFSLILNKSLIVLYLLKWRNGLFLLWDSMLCFLGAIYITITFNFHVSNRTTSNRENYRKCTYPLWRFSCSLASELLSRIRIGNINEHVLCGERKKKLRTISIHMHRSNISRSKLKTSLLIEKLMLVFTKKKNSC